MITLPPVLSQAQAEVGRRLLAFRNAQGMTMEELGGVLGVTKANVQKLEKGQLRISSDFTYILARKYGLNPLYLLLLSDNMYDSSLRKIKTAREIL